MQDVPVQEEVDQLRARFGKFGMLVEFMPNARERGQFARHARVAQQLEKTLAALGRDCDIRKSVNQYRRSKCFRDIGCRTGGAICCFIASIGHKSRSKGLRVDHGNRIKRDTSCELRSSFWRPALTFEFGTVCSSGGKQGQVT